MKVSYEISKTKAFKKAKEHQLALKELGEKEYCDHINISDFVCALYGVSPKQENME